MVSRHGEVRKELFGKSRASLPIAMATASAMADMRNPSKNASTGSRAGLSIRKAPGLDQAQNGDSSGLAARSVAAELCTVFLSTVARRP